MQCDHGYCTMDILTPDGKPLRVAPALRSVYEFDLRWWKDNAQTLVTWQDLKTDGGNRVDLRPHSGGTARTLAAPAGSSVISVGFADDDRGGIVVGVPNGNAMQRIPVPPVARKP